jgi:hypothetical protein
MSNQTTAGQKVVTYPTCKCSDCGMLFTDTMGVYPGPAMCRECVAAAKAKAKKRRPRY